MKAVEFAYWLQGYFELVEDQSVISLEQTELILKKVNSVKAGSTPSEVQAQEFSIYVKGALETAYSGGSSLAGVSKILKEKLNDLFVHAIDQSYTGDQTTFNDIHGGGFKPPGNGMRC